MEKNQRQICFDALIGVYKDKGYSSIVLDKHISKINKNSKQNKNFITRIFYGVLERDLTLEYIINSYSKRKASKLDIEIAVILKMAIYELIYMDNVPDNATVNESVNLCKYARKTSASAVVNAILRNFIRDKKEIKISQKDKNYLSIMYSCPQWIIDMWVKDYGVEQTKKLLEASLQKPPLTIRVNTQLITADELIEIFNKSSIVAKKCEYIENCLEISKAGDIEKIEAFQKGYFYVQDLASQYCAKIVDAKPNDLVYDICAAPGSKSFTIAQYMKNQGEILAFDLHDHKIELISKTASKLKLTSIKALHGDGEVFNQDLALADKVLCDVPCSGLGIIRRKPEIKYKTEQEIAQLPFIQYSILKNASKYVKKDGVLIYSTCSLNKKENEKIVLKFLQENKDFVGLEMPNDVKEKVIVEKNMATFMPHMINSDGFFIATFKRSDNNA